MARSIDAMADAGISVIIFDWYRYDDGINGGEMLEEALRKGFLQGTNRNRIKFSLMWANHTYIDCHPFAPGGWFNNALIRKLMLAKMQRADYRNGRNEEIKAWVDERPEVKQRIEERIRNVPAANRERAFINAAKTEAQNQAMRPANGVRP